MSADPRLEAAWKREEWKRFASGVETKEGNTKCTIFKGIRRGETRAAFCLESAWCSGLDGSLLLNLLAHNFIDPSQTLIDPSTITPDYRLASTSLLTSEKRKFSGSKSPWVRFCLIVTGAWRVENFFSSWFGNKEIYSCARSISFSLLLPMSFAFLLPPTRKRLSRKRKSKHCSRRNMRWRRKTVANYPDREQHKFRDWVKKNPPRSSAGAGAFFLPSKHIIMRRARIMFRTKKFNEMKRLFSLWERLFWESLSILTSDFVERHVECEPSVVMHGSAELRFMVLYETASTI